MDEFEEELKKGFLEEATQMIGDTEQCFLTLETSPEDRSILEKIFRLAHNLKGSAKAVGFDKLGAFAHELESYLLKLKDGTIAVQSNSVSLLLRCNDHLSQTVEGLKSNFNATIDPTELLDEIHRQMSGEMAETPAVPAVAEEMGAALVEEASVLPRADDPGFSDLDAETTVEVHQAVVPAAAPTATITAPGLGDMLAGETKKQLAASAGSTDSAKTEGEPHQAPAAGNGSGSNVPAANGGQNVPAANGGQNVPAANSGQNVIDENIRVSLRRLDKLINFVGELVILQAVLKEQIQVSGSMFIRKTTHQLGKVTKEIQDISMGLRMIPLNQTFHKMQRIVRDTSTALGKKVHLTLLGEETEVDKTVLENLSDPLVHLIRNAVDHGIESAEERIRNGKNEAGTIVLSAFQQSGFLVIEISDDGGGMDLNRLKAKAIEKGIVKPNAQLTEKETYALIFASGFSTKTVVTDVSGRGVGMDVVKTNIEALQGEIQLETKLGQGTRFRIQLPLTLAIIDGMVVRCQDQRFVIPLSYVHESTQPSETDIHQATGIGELFSLRGEHLPVYRLEHLLNLRNVQSKPISQTIAIVVRSRQTSFVVLADEIIGLYQVVIKKLGQEHHNLHGFSGSAILGDGKPALILELVDLVLRYQTKPPKPVSSSNVRSISPGAASKVEPLRRNVV